MDRMGFQIDTTAHRGYFSLGQDFRGASNDMPVGNAFDPETIDVHIDRQVVLEKGGGAIVAGAMNARPSVEIRPLWALGTGKHRPATMAEHRVLRLFHVKEKGREVNNPSRVGFCKLDAPIPRKNWVVTRRHKA